MRLYFFYNNMIIFYALNTGTLIELVEYVNNGITTAVMWNLKIVGIIFSIFSIASKNPIMCVLFLISLFICVSFYLVFLGLTFIALAYLLVYVGAVSILFLFILMLINVRISELLHDTRNSIILAIAILILLYTTVGYMYLNYVVLGNSKTFWVSSDKWDGNLAETNHITSIGNIMYTDSGILLIIVSIILLLAMVGAIVITIKPSEGKKHRLSFFLSSAHLAKPRNNNPKPNNPKPNNPKPNNPKPNNTPENPTCFPAHQKTLSGIKKNVLRPALIANKAKIK